MRRLLVLVVPALSCGCGPAPLEPRDPTPGATHFTIQTFNVAADRFGDTPTLEAVGYANADIVCLQETGWEWEPVLRARYAEQYPNMLFHSTGSSGGSGGLAVLSRFPLLDEGVLAALNDWHPAWALSVETERGPVRILNLHLRAILSGRSNGAEEYLTVDADHLAEIKIFAADFRTPARSLVVGDFNETPEGPALQYLDDQGYRDILPLYHPGQGTWHSPSLGGQLDKTLDHVLFDNNFAPLNSWVVRRGNSDHIPVVAHIEIVDTVL